MKEPLFDVVTEQTQTVLTPIGDTSHDLGKESTPGESVREFYRQQGRFLERCRIIELLVDNYESCHTDDFDGLQEAVALIKGENK